MNMQLISTILFGTLGFVGVSFVGIIGWFIRTSWSELKKQNNETISVVNQIKYEMGNINIVMAKNNFILESIERDFERANSSIETHGKIITENQKRITDHGHSINNVKNQIASVVKFTDQIDEEVEELKKKVNKLENGTI